MDQQESIEDIREKFEQWRLTRKTRREHIPASLWKSAAILTQDHSINVVAKALRLNGCDLKKKIQKYCNQPPVQPRPPSDFIELTCDLPSLTPTEYVVELADQKGSRMRISMKGNLDVPGLIQSFWEKSK
ncbi:MAG: hypothetical protein KKH68_01345 [Proteobacteria bacterium]|nr:hypothetical protein [Pseudomonadota bacterium]